MGLPWCLSQERIHLQCWRPECNPWVGKIPWRGERLPTLVFWPGEFHRLYSPWGCKESDTTEWLSLSCIYIFPLIFLSCAFSYILRFSPFLYFFLSYPLFSSTMWQIYFEVLSCTYSSCFFIGGGLVAKSCLTFATSWTIAHQAPLSMGFSRQEYWGGLPFLFPGDLPDPGTEPGFSTWQADSLPTELWGKPIFH